MKGIVFQQRKLCCPRNKEPTANILLVCVLMIFSDCQLSLTFSCFQQLNGVSPWCVWEWLRLVTTPPAVTLKALLLKSLGWYWRIDFWAGSHLVSWCMLPAEVLPHGHWPGVTGTSPGHGPRGGS